MDDTSPLDRFPEYVGRDLHDLAAYLAQAQADLEDLRKKSAALQGRVDFLRDIALPHALDEAGLKNATVDGVGRVALTHDLYASIKVEDRDAAFNWLRENGHEALIVETVNAQTLRAWAKEQIRNGKPISERIGLRPFTRATLTKA